MAELIVDGQSVKISNPDKLLFPEDGISKGDLIEYYRRVPPHMLPHVRGRPLHMQRFPDGIGGEEFQQKRIPSYFPDWISRVEVRMKGGSLTHPVIDNAATLVYLANQAVITPHVWTSCVERLDYPDQLIFDLDPSGIDFEPVRFAARVLRELLEGLDLAPFLKTTGSRGLHLIVPLDASADFERVHSFARAVAQLLASLHPSELTVETRKQKRAGRLYLDTARNAYAQTTVAPYAVRARRGAPVAMPIAWKELSDKELRGDSYNLGNVFRRLARRPDPWAAMSKKAHSLGDAERRLSAMLSDQPDSAST
jgi:bifunctional non-homologous end joining protein LigD